jgi:SAM-dependent methyltransferase
VRSLHTLLYLAHPLVWRARFYVPHALAAAGVLRYKPHGPADPGAWDALYDSGELDFYENVDGLARYGVLAAYLRRIEARSILDIGCGPGILRRFIEGVGFTSYVGIDHSPAAIARAKQYEDDRTTFTTAERMPPEEGPFHVVVSNDMLLYVEDAGEFLDYVSELLEPGGFFLSAVWRHSRDVVLQRRIDERFDLVDRVLIKQLASDERPRWIVAWHAKRG